MKFPSRRPGSLVLGQSRGGGGWGGRKKMGVAKEGEGGGGGEVSDK